MTNIFSILEAAIPSLHGWCSLPKSHTFASSVIALRSELTVEIGVYGGRSLLSFALAHKEIGFGTVWGIDPWNSGASAEGQLNPEDLKFWSGLDHEMIYRDCMEKLGFYGVDKCVKIFRKRSDQVELPSRIDVLHLDGNHGEQAFKDAQRWAPKVRVGGLMFCDDIAWTGGGVVRATEWLKANGFVELYRQEQGAMFQRQRAW